MKATCLLFIGLFLCTSQLVAQQSEVTPASTPKYKREIGVNITPMFATLFGNFNSNTTNSSDFISYRIWKSENTFNRYNLGISAQYINSSGDNTSTDRLNLGLQGKVGWGKKYNFTDKLYVMTGFDLFAGFTNRSADGQNLSLINAGLGPFMGLQYDITDRVGLYTETTAYLVGTHQIYDDDRSTTSIRLQYGLPVNINVFCKF